MAKLYGTIMSGNVQRALLTAYELNVHLERIDLPVTSPAIKEPAYVAKHPFGQIPLYEESNGFVLFESRAIMRYLNLKSGGKLGSTTDPTSYGLVESWLSVEQSNFNDAVAKIRFELLVKRMRGGEPDVNIVDEQKKRLAGIFDVYETRLSKAAYLAGNEYTIADLSHVPLSNYLFEDILKEALDSRPHLKAWWGKVSGRPSVQKLLSEVAAAMAAMQANFKK